MFSIAIDEPDKEGWIVAHIVQAPSVTGRGRTMQEARTSVLEALRQKWAPAHGPKVKELLDLACSEGGLEPLV